MVLKFPPARKFPTELKKMKYEIEAYAQNFGLDFFPVIFEVLDYKDLNEVAAYGGFPQRYPHWYFGMQFEGLSKSYAYGLSKIYEMVINNDPCYAYLLKCNNLVDQKLVMAHVYAHCDFFRNNLYFCPYEPENGRRNGQPCHPDSAVRGPLRGRNAGGLHRLLPLLGKPHRSPSTFYPAPE